MEYKNPSQLGATISLGGGQIMTKKQFNWLRNNWFSIEVSWVDVYKGKEPKNFHYLHYLDALLVGERFYFSGKYYTFNGRTLDEHHGKYDIHYRNIRVIRYRRKY